MQGSVPADGVPIIVSHLSQHFKSRWEKRVGMIVPSAEELNGLIVTGIRISGFEKLYRREGLARFKEVKKLGTYWVPEHHIVVWIDEEKGTAVTVISSTSCRRVVVEVSSGHLKIARRS